MVQKLESKAYNESLQILFAILINAFLIAILLALSLFLPTSDRGSLTIRYGLRGFGLLAGSILALLAMFGPRFHAICKGEKFEKKFMKSVRDLDEQWKAELSAATTHSKQSGDKYKGICKINTHTHIYDTHMRT